MLKHYNEAVIEGNFLIQPCAFLHNYELKEGDALLDEKYASYVEWAPVFAKGEIGKLRNFIRQYIHYGDQKKALYCIENGRITPSKMLQDSLKKMLQGNQEFVLLDRQFSVYEKGLYFAQKSYADQKKRVLIVKGGPGTGKSVVAIQLLVTLMSQNEHNKIPLNTVYVTKNDNPRYVYMSKLQGEYTKTYIKNLFKGAQGTFVNSEENTFDVIVCDEAHRLMKNSGRFYPGSHSQIEDIIHAAECSIFFIDEYQKICLDDYGSVEHIVDVAKAYGAEYEIMELESQFRCNGSDAYLKWLEDVLEMNSNANANDMGVNYDFRVVDTPNEVCSLIERLNRKNDRSRVVAGYCWNWKKEGRRNKNVYDIEIGGYDFRRSWNIPTGTWAIDKGSVEQIGCIHTCQGLEFDYVGVIIGNDLRYEEGRIITDYTKRAKTDQSLRGIRKMYREDPQDALSQAEEIIKNTYRVLLSRGMKGCYVYCEDKKLAEYLKQRLEKCKVDRYEVTVDEEALEMIKDN